MFCAITGILACRNPIQLACEAYVIEQFPWADGTFIPKVPDFNADDTEVRNGFFSDPLKDGVSLNVNFGGHYSVWTQSPELTFRQKVTQCIGYYQEYQYSYLGFYQYYSDLLYFPEGPGLIDSVTSYYRITDPTVGSWYDFKGGDFTGDVLIGTGHFEFSGIATTDAFSNNGQIQALNNGYPVLYESWFDTNKTAHDPLIGYSNYTLYMNQRSPVPWVYFTDPGGFVKKYKFGIFDLLADVETCDHTSILFGAILQIDPTNSSQIVVQLIVNRIVVKEEIFVGNALSADSYFQTVLRFLPARAGGLAGTMNEVSVGWSGGGSGYLYHTADYTTVADFYDTRRTKFAWFIHADNGLGLGVIDVDNPFGGDVPSMATHPGWPLPCAPSTDLPYIPAISLPS